MLSNVRTLEDATTLVEEPLEEEPSEKPLELRPRVDPVREEKLRPVKSVPDFFFQHFDPLELLS